MYLGMDFGGTKVAFRAEYGEGAGEGRKGAAESTFRWPETRTLADDLAVLRTHTRAVRDGLAGTVEAVGVAMPATLDAAGRVVAWPNRPFWEGVDLRAELAELLPGARIACADDGDLAGLAEADAAGCDHLVYLGVGTGVGGGAVRRGDILPGPDRGSCEIGHMVVDRSGERCDCGRRGCVQAIASGPATLRRASAARGAPVHFTELRDAYAAGDRWAVEALDDTCAALAAAATNLGELLRPDRVVIGGGFAAGIPGLVAEVAARTAKLSRPGTPTPPVHAARLAGLSSLHGALLLARRA
ncbi:ROK family protein [Streptomyces sp. TRM64462]|uniref:ROK family protein n=1 Tax=Streptomyces sp. TRM64462 TaxID=2741726 RepID=UPI001586E59F|nr:ROK family protein [Streptomyces sp. TRM64462]